MLLLIDSDENSLEKPIAKKNDTRIIFFVTLRKVTINQPEKGGRFKLLSNLQDIIIL